MPNHLLSHHDGVFSLLVRGLLSSVNHTVASFYVFLEASPEGLLVYRVIAYRSVHSPHPVVANVVVGQ